MKKGATSINKRELGLKSLFLFSLPSIFSSLLEPITGTVDTAMIGQLDTDLLAALAIGVIVLSSFTWMFNFLLHASTKAIAEAGSENNHSKLCQKFKISLFLAITIGILSSGFLYLFRYQLFSLAGAQSKLLPFINDYFLIRLIGHPFTLISGTMIAVLRGFGEVRFSFLIIIVTTVVNIFFSWLFLYVFDFGIVGVAWGSVISVILASLLSTLKVFSRTEISQNFFSVKIEKEHFLVFGKNSLDLFGRSFCLTACFFIATKIASGFGTLSLAAHQILLELWLFSSFFIDGVAITGNIYGAKYFTLRKKEEVKRLSVHLLIIGGGIGLLFSFIYAIFNTSIWSLFTNDERVKDILESLWWIVAWSQGFMAVAYVYDGLLFGLGQFSHLRKFMIFGLLFIFSPFAYHAYSTGSLFYLWVALISLGLFRILMGHLGIKQALKELDRA